MQCVTIGPKPKVPKISDEAVSDGLQQPHWGHKDSGILPSFIIDFSEQVSIFKAHHNSARDELAMCNKAVQGWPVAVMYWVVPTQLHIA